MATIKLEFVSCTP